MTTTKDYIRKTAWFTSNGLPDPRLEGPETKVTFNLQEYWDRFRRMIGSMKLIGKRKEFINSDGMIHNKGRGESRLNYWDSMNSIDHPS